jgi:hypothetical protein
VKNVLPAAVAAAAAAVLVVNTAAAVVAAAAAVAAVIDPFPITNFRRAWCKPSPFFFFARPRDDLRFQRRPAFGTLLWCHIHTQKFASP